MNHLWRQNSCKSLALGPPASSCKELERSVPIVDKTLQDCPARAGISPLELGLCRMVPLRHNVQPRWCCNVSCLTARESLGEFVGKSPQFGRMAYH